MSYRISLIRIDPTLATADAMQRALADMERLAHIVGSNAFEAVAPADRARFEDIARHREAAASALVASDPTLRRAEIDHEATAARLGVAVRDLRIFEPVLLRSDDLHIEMTGDGATIVIEKPTRDRDRMERVWAFIEALARHGYNAFDPQLEESIVPAFGFDRYYDRWGVWIG
jgi:hypothetical protein